MTPETLLSLKIKIEELLQEIDSKNTTIEILKTSEHILSKKCTAIEEEIATTKKCLFQMQNAAIEMAKELADYREALQFISNTVWSSDDPTGHVTFLYENKARQVLSKWAKREEK